MTTLDPCSVTVDKSQTALKTCSSRITFVIVSLVSGLCATLASHAVWAQTTTLGSFGDTPLQQVTGDAVQTVCGTLVANPGQRPTGSTTADLFMRCGEMVHTANFLAMNNGPTALNLGLSEDELAGALQQLTNEEIASQGTLATSTSHGQLANLGARLSAIRAGAGGVSLAGLTLFLDDKSVSLAGLEHAMGGGADADELGAFASPWGFFVNGGFGTGDTDATPQEDAFDFDQLNLTTGIDYRFDSGFVLGAAVGYSDFDADFDTTSNLTVNGGSTESDGITVSLFGVYGQTDGLYVEGLASFGDVDYDMTRVVQYATEDRVANGETSSDQSSLGFGVGYQLTNQSTSYGPFLRYRYLDIDIDGYTETGSIGELALVFDEQTIESSQTILGFNVAKSISRGFGVLGLSARVDWRHEFDDDIRNVTARYVFDPNNFVLPIRSGIPDEDFFTVGLGITGVFKNGLQGFAQVESVFGLEDISNYGLQFGLRKQF